MVLVLLEADTQRNEKSDQNFILSIFNTSFPTLKFLQKLKKVTDNFIKYFFFNKI